MISKLVIRMLSWSFIYGTVIASDWNDDFDTEDLFNREDLFDKTTRKLKPVREVIEDHQLKDFPKINDCGPDETQNWMEPDPLDCSCYFSCNGKFYVHGQCSKGLFFDVKTLSCNWADDVDCTDRQMPWTIPEYMGPHHVYQHYNLLEFVNSKLEKPQPPSHSDKEQWSTFDETEDKEDTLYEYAM